MIGVKKILDILELVVWSAHIKGEKPVSVLLTAPVEAGKTELVMKFAQNKGCVALTDVTAYGIMRDYGQPIARGEVRHLIILDMIKPLSRGKDTVHTLIAFLNSLIEEGIIRISTYAERIGAPDSGKVETSVNPVKCGLIATLPKGVLLDGRHHWSRMGFMSRLLPISYEYGPATQLEIHKSIAKGDYHIGEPVKLELPSEDVLVTLPPKEGEEVMSLTGILLGLGAKASPEKVYGFRLQKQLQTLVMASALKDGRDLVTPSDIEYIRSLSGCINLEYYPI